jgi:Flp pilus assembly protein TadG
MRNHDSERGATLLMVALMLVALLAVLALSVDVGAGYIERRRLQSVADAASLAGVQVMDETDGSPSQILAAVQEYAVQRTPPANNEDRQYTVHWLVGATPSGVVGRDPRPQHVTGVQVTLSGTTPTMFASVLGITEVSASASGGGGYSPLDVMLVLDRSGSMAYDSCLLHDASSGVNLRLDFNPGGHCANGGNPSQSACGNCGGYWGTSGPCRWQSGGAVMSPAPAVCGSVDTKTSCEACKGYWLSNEEPITSLKTAATNFVNQVEAELRPTNPRIGLVSYSTSATLNRVLTEIDDVGLVRSAISGLSADGSTNCEDALYQAREQLYGNGRVTAVKVIVFMTDGNANTGRGCAYVCADASQRAINQATLARTQGILTYTIGLGIDSDQDMLRTIASEGGGEYVYAPTAADLDAAFAEMFDKIKRLRLVETS